MKKFTKTDIEIANKLSDFINGKICDKKTIAAMMARDHRFLVQSWFEVAYNFIHALAMDYENKKFDARNEWACKLAHEFMQSPSVCRTPWADKEMTEYVESVFFNI